MAFIIIVGKVDVATIQMQSLLDTPRQFHSHNFEIHCDTNKGWLLLKMWHLTMQVNTVCRVHIKL